MRPSRFGPLVRFVPVTIIASLLAAAAPRLAADDTPPAPVTAPADLANLKYRSVGPWHGGRATRAASVPGDPATYYVATASGGLWKSTNGGSAWAPIFDDQPISSIGSLAIAPSDPNVIYVGSGEANIRGNVAAGNGIYVSRDAGKTWTHAWKQEGQIGTMAVHPRRAEVAFAAVLGHAFGPNPERGVYRTTDGGKTWQQVLKKDADTGASDVAIDPNNPHIVFAGLWQARRTPWSLTSGGSGSGLYISRDGGDTWTQLTGKGLPEGVWGKVGIAIAPSDSRRVYALIEADAGGLFRSDDGGDTWTLATADRALRQRAWYYTTLTVHPTNPNEVWFPQVPLLRTIDGGRTIEYMKGYRHGDHHDAWFDPQNPKRVVIANDGGVEYSLDGGETWAWPLLPIAQFYHVSTDTRVPYDVAGAMQDIGTAQGPSDSLASNGIVPGDYHHVGGGEAGHVVSDWQDPNIVYAGEYLGIITRYDHRTKQIRHVGAWPDNPSGWSAADMKYRFQWTAPIHVSPHDAKTVYHGAQVVFRTRDGGQSWSVISGDLTRNDVSKQQWSGGPITGDNTGVETFATVFAIAESPAQRDVIWAGSDDGLVHVTRDGGKSWTNVTAALPGAPQFGTISMIEPSRTAAGTAYVVIDAHRLDDMRPYLYRTSDFGKSFVRLDASLAQDVYLHVLREDPTNPALLYLGTERGVMLSRDAGATWEPFRLNLPTVAVHDLAFGPSSLVVGTHGRALWILDDLSLVRQMTRAISGSPAHLFPVADTVAWRIASRQRERTSASNPPHGVVMHYWLKDEVKTPVTLEIRDAQGRVVKTLKSEPPPAWGIDDDPKAEDDRKGDLTRDKGLNRAVWTLSWEGATPIARAKIDLGSPFAGATAVPGRYTAVLTVDGTSFERPFVITQDPRVTVTDKELSEQVTFSLSIRDEVTRLGRLVDDIRHVRGQVAARREALARVDPRNELIAASEAVITKLDSLEGRLHNPTAEVTYDILAMKTGAHLYSRLIPLLDWSTSGDGAPTQGQRELAATLRSELDALARDYTALIDMDVKFLNTKGAAHAFVITPKP